MIFSPKYHHEVKNDVKTLPKNIKDRIRKAIEDRLILNPLKFGEPLRYSMKGYRKLRVGDFRIIYKIEKQFVVILKIGHRKEVYKKLGRS